MLYGEVFVFLMKEKVFIFREGAFDLWDKRDVLSLRRVRMLLEGAVSIVLWDFGEKVDLVFIFELN